MHIKERCVSYMHQWAYDPAWFISLVLLVLRESPHKVTLNITLQEQSYYISKVLIW